MLWVIIVLAAGLVYLWYRSGQRYALRVPDLQKKCVFITGCDSGFGQAIAVRLDGLGVPVFAGCLTEQGANNLAQKCSSRLKTIRLDVTSTESILDAYKDVSSNIPPGCEFWGVLNNAGIIGMDGPCEFATRDDYRRLLEVNFLGMTDVNTAFLPLLKKSCGRIVNMASVSGFAVLPTFATYAASKQAVVAYSNILRMEKSIWGIHVSIVAPGGFRTNILDSERYTRERARKWESVSSELQEQYGENQYNAVTAAKIKWQDRDAPADLSPVVNAYEHALFGRHPRSHYYPDKQGKLMYCLHLLPQMIYDKIMIREFVTKPIQYPNALMKK